MGYWEALQERLNQTVETVTRSSRIDIVGGGVDEINPPEDIDQYAEQAKTNAIARANLRKFVHDVWEPGYRVEGPEETVAYFEGDKEDIDAQLPEGTPEGGFLQNSTVFAGERYQDFYDFGKECSWQRWARGTNLIEYLKNDPEDPESVISGFRFIRPETVYPQVENNTNILLEPEFEDLPDDISRQDVTFTRRDEVAAYIQFDDESILGLRRNGFDQQDVPLSQNDVLKQTLEPDIGGDIQKGEGVFGTSAIEPVSEDISEYEQTKRDLFEGNQRKAYGVWTAQFTPEVIDLGDTKEIIEWDDDSISDTEAELESMGPGDVLTSDAIIDLERHSGDVPDIEWVLMHYVKDISSALPTPLPMAVDFAGDINRDVTSDQREGFQQFISEERQFQEISWTQALKFVAERQGLPTEGLEFKIQPPKQDNPVKSLETEEIDRMNTYVSTLATAAGPQAGPTALVDRQELLEVLDFPTSEESVEDVVDEVAQQGDEAAQDAWEDILDVGKSEALSESDVDRIADSVVEALDFTPALHPRDPRTGKFVERPYNVPDDIAGLDTGQIIGELAAANDDFAEQVEGIAVDLPGDDDGSAVPTEIQELIDNPDAGSGGSIEDIGPIDVDDVSEGDVVRNNGIAYEITNVNEGGFTTSLSGERLDKPFSQSETIQQTENLTTAGVAEEGRLHLEGDGSTIRLSGIVNTEYGPKALIESERGAKEDIKSLDWDETHRSWDSQRGKWTIDLQNAESAARQLNEMGYNVLLSNSIQSAAEN